MFVNTTEIRYEQEVILFYVIGSEARVKSVVIIL